MTTVLLSLVKTAPPAPAPPLLTLVFVLPASLVLCANPSLTLALPLPA